MQAGMVIRSFKAKFLAIGIALPAMVSPDLSAEDPPPAKTEGGGGRIVTPTAAEADSALFEDKEYGIQMSAPEGWQTTNPVGFSVPGKIRKVWVNKSKTEGSIVIFVQNPGVPVSARDLLEPSVAQMRGLDCEVKEQAVKDIAGMRSMWMLAAGNGTGTALIKEGSIRTAQLWLAIPREKDVIFVLLTAPENNFESARKVFEKAIATLTVTGTQTKGQKEAK